jgi:hypothetical protein
MGPLCAFLPYMAKRRLPQLLWGFHRGGCRARMLPEGKDDSLREAPEWARERGVAMPWFPDFASAVELARGQTRAAGLADPVGQYFTALNEGDPHALADVWPG